MPRGVRAADAGYSIWQPTDLRVPLPYRPLWRGVLTNSALYALAWSVLIMLVLVPKAWRRARRHRTGCCVSCGYSLAGLAANAPCPECGKGKDENR